MDLIVHQYPISFGLTGYLVKRDHCNVSEIFKINVPEVGQKGYGVQVRLGKIRRRIISLEEKCYMVVER